MSKLTSPIALIIMDGWGIGDQADEYNAIARTELPNISDLLAEYPATRLTCCGEAVGLPEGQMGNSEVGHLNIGAGRIIYQELTRISRSVQDGDFYNNKVFLDIIKQVKQANSTLHLMGLLSDGGVHSHNSHLYALLKLAKLNNLTNVYIHAFLDGRDTPPQRALGYIAELEARLAEFSVGKIASVSGRYYAMDRDKRWERTEKAYRTLVYQEGRKADSARQAVEQSYAEGINDEFVLPVVIKTGSKSAIKENDGVIFFNFRPDRARQLTRALLEQNFDGFERRFGCFKLHYATMTQYDESFTAAVAFPPSYPDNTLGELFSKQGYRQLCIAETEKYAHVTYFFSGGKEEGFAGEDRILVPSPKVATYDLKPSMSAKEVTDKALEAINKKQYDLIVLNYANCDMVGHTGIFSAAHEAIAVVDEGVGRLAAAMLACGGIVCITADHGNAEVMVDHETGEPYTAHTTNDVPFILVSEKHKDCKMQAGILADIAPTILSLAKITIPKEMTGKNLLNLEE